MTCNCHDCQAARRSREQWVHVPERLQNMQQVGEPELVETDIATEREHSARLTKRIGVLEDENTKLRDQLSRSDNELCQLRGRL